MQVSEKKEFQKFVETELSQRLIRNPHLEQRYFELCQKELALKLEKDRLREERKLLEKEMAQRLEGQVLFAWEEEG